MNQYPHCACHLSFSFLRFPSRSLYPSQPCSLRSRLCLARCHSPFPHRLSPSLSVSLRLYLFPSSLLLTHLHVFFSRFLLTVVGRLSTLFRYRSLPSFLAHRSVSLLGRLFSPFAYRLSSSLYIFYLDRVVTVSVSSTLSLSVYERVRSTFFLLVRRERT